MVRYLSNKRTKIASVVRTSSFFAARGESRLLSTTLGSAPASGTGVAVVVATTELTRHGSSPRMTFVPLHPGVTWVAHPRADPALTEH